MSKSKSTIIIYILVVINLILTITVGLIVFKEISYQKDKSTIYTKENLLRDAKFQCLEEINKTDCGYVKDIEEQIQKLNQELVK